MIKVSKIQWIMLAAIVILTAIVIIEGIALVYYIRNSGTTRLTEIPQEPVDIPQNQEEIKTVESDCTLSNFNSNYNKRYKTVDKDATVKMSSPMKTVLCLDEINPMLGNPLNLKYFVAPSWDAPNTTVTIELPPQVTLLDGELTWSGDLTTGFHVHELLIQIDELPEPIPVNSSDYYHKLAAIKAIALSEPPESGQFGEVRWLFLRATDYGIIETSDKPFVTAPVDNRSKAFQFDEKSVNVTSPDRLSVTRYYDTPDNVTRP